MAEANKYRLVLAYVGTNFQGWQRQSASNTDTKTSIQSLIELACQKVLATKVHLQASGRTDSGVHARRQVAHLKAECKLAPEILLKALNALLPNEIRVLSLELSDPDFHAQKSAKAKTYRYFILNNTEPGRHINWPFLREYTWFVSQPLDLSEMEKCLDLLKGEHDFKAFQNRGTPVKSTTRTLWETKLIVHPPKSTTDFPWDVPAEMKLQLLEVRLTGNGFLKQMVRNIMGTLVDVGQRKTSLEEFAKILEGRDRRAGGITAPARGLFLDSVDYQTESL